MRILASLLCVISVLGGAVASASCFDTGKAAQTVFLSVEGKNLDRWEPNGDIHRVRLPQGFELGLQIQPATPEKYRELFARHARRGIDELVKIDLFDMSTSPPKLVSNTWGGANSRQGFGPRGGANGVPVMLDQIELWLHKPACITPDAIAAIK